MKTTSIIYQRFVCTNLLLLSLCMLTPVAFSQNVTILPSGITPNQGGAIPRLSYDAIQALPNPQNGDMAYDLTFNCVRYYRKNKWLKMLKPEVYAWMAKGMSI